MEEDFKPAVFLKTGRALIDVFEGELTIRVGKEAITFNLDQTSRYSADYNDMTAKRIDVIDMACEEYSQEALGFFDVIATGNPTPYYDPIVSITSSTLTSFGNSDFLLEEVDAFLALEDDLTSPKSIKVNGVTDDALCLYLFPHSLTHHATAWFDRLPRSSINTFKKMAKMFLGKYFPPFMVTKLRNEITNFRQRLDESLFEAWERYKLSILRCPNHNMFRVTQIDTFYNGLTLRHRDTITVAAGGTFMKRHLKECYDLIENMTAHHNDWDTSTQQSESSSSITSSSDTEIAALKAEMAEINRNLIRVLQVNQQVKEVTLNCKTCGGPHSFNDCTATVGNTQNVYAAGAYQGNSYQPQGNRNLLSYRLDNYLVPLGSNQNQNQNNQNQNFHNQNRNQGNHNPQGNNQGRNQFFQGANKNQNPPRAYQAPAYQAPVYQAPVHQPQIPQPQVVTTNKFTNFMKENDAILKNMQTNMTSLTNLNLELKNMFSQFMKMNTTSSLGLGTLPVNPITNPKEDLKGITTRSGTTYQGPTIPTTFSSLPLVVERENRASWSDKLIYRKACHLPIELEHKAYWALKHANFDLQNTGENRASWSDKLIYRKACHLPIELEHKAYWALKHANFDLQNTGNYRKVQLNELRDQAYENSLIYKEKTKRLYDSKIKDRVFNIDDRVLLFNS
nr:hypothetical protein [Tanacetum cinerariifolium]